MSDNAYFRFLEADRTGVIVFWTRFGSWCTQKLRTMGDVEEAVSILQGDELLEEEDAQKIVDGFLATKLPSGKACLPLREGHLITRQVTMVIPSAEDAESAVLATQHVM